MKNKAILIFGLFFSLLLSCNDNIEFSGKSANFGVAQYYDDFLWVKNDTVILTKELKFEFNKYAVEKESFVAILLVDNNQEIINDSNIQLFINGKYMPDNKFRVNSLDSNKGIISIGIKLLPNYKEGYCSGYISISNHSLDIINNNDLATSTESRLFKWEAEHDKVINPLVKFLVWVLSIFLVLILSWFLIIRNSFYPKFKKGKIQILNPYFKGIKIDKSVMQIVFTKKSKKQSFFSKLFKGKIQYEINVLFDKNIMFTPGRGNKVKVKLPLGYKIKPIVSNLDKFNTYKIEVNKQTIEFQYL